MENAKNAKKDSGREQNKEKGTFQSMEKGSVMVDLFHSQYVDGSKQTFFTQSQGRPTY